MKREKNISIVRNVIKQIEKEYKDSTITPTRIAEGMNMSSAYLGRIFRSVTDKSISEYINYIRIDNAKKLLLSTDMKLEDIIRSVGIENTKYFFVLFKKYTNMTPTKYRTENSNA